MLGEHFCHVSQLPVRGEQNGNSIMIDVPASVAVLIQNEIGASILQRYLNKGKKEQNCKEKTGPVSVELEKARRSHRNPGAARALRMASRALSGGPAAARRGEGAVNVRKKERISHAYPSAPKSQISHAKPPDGSSTPPFVTASPVSRSRNSPGVLRGAQRSPSEKLKNAASFSPFQ